MNADIESVRYNYVALKQLHKVANNTNDELNSANEQLKTEVDFLKEQTAELQKVVLIKNKMITDSYTNLNNIKNDYNDLISQLHSKIKRLEDGNID